MHRPPRICSHQNCHALSNGSTYQHQQLHRSRTMIITKSCRPLPSGNARQRLYLPHLFGGLEEDVLPVPDRDITMARDAAFYGLRRVMLFGRYTRIYPPFLVFNTGIICTTIRIPSLNVTIIMIHDPSAYLHRCGLFRRKRLCSLVF
jgi:hypothetical protein